MSPSATTSKESALPRLRWAWDFGPLLGDVDTGRLLALLTAVAEEGALGNAAKRAGMSYRSAWGLLRDCEQALGAALVAMERGRGTQLTEFGASLVQLDAAARTALEAVHAPWQRRLEELLAPVVRAVPERLRLAASHDLALADWVEHGRRIRFDLFWRGSEEALAELGRDECDVAGFHVPESCTVAQLTNWLARWLKPGAHLCLPLMRRCQGLIVARGNPHRLQTLADASKRGLRMVNRQRGSGTRSMIDQLTPSARDCRAGSRPGRRPTFLLVQASRQRSTPRLPGLTASGYPRCGRPAGPVAKLAARCAVVVGQRDRTSPGEPPSLGGSEGMERRRAWFSRFAYYRMSAGPRLGTCRFKWIRCRRPARSYTARAEVMVTNLSPDNKVGPYTLENGS
jgi:molybdate transport repressor ModE-like protein